MVFINFKRGNVKITYYYYSLFKNDRRSTVIGFWCCWKNVRSFINRNGAYLVHLLYAPILYWKRSILFGQPESLSNMSVPAITVMLVVIVPWDDDCCHGTALSSTQQRENQKSTIRLSSRRNDCELQNQWETGKRTHWQTEYAAAAVAISPSITLLWLEWTW